MYTELQSKIGIAFKNKELYETAFTHRSYLNEHRHLKRDHNERLEFLGDAVLELVATEFLFQNYTDRSEGELTNWRSALVRGENLARIAKALGLGEYLYLSKGEENSGGREKNFLLANVFEALVGAMYLDHGYGVAQRFIEKFLLVHLETIIAKGLHIDPKSQFQEMAQEKVSITPVYELVEESGPDHNKTFVMGAYLDNKLVGKGKGSSKQLAEQEAAKSALKNQGWLQG